MFKSWSFLLKYIWPPSVISGVLTLVGEWNRSSVKTKAMLAVFFVPAIFCVGGLVICVAYFILFKLPSFILSVLGWLLLISLFSGCGLYFYEKVTGKQVKKGSQGNQGKQEAKKDSVPFDFDVTPEAEGSDKDKKNWFDDMKWFKKK